MSEFAERREAVVEKIDNAVDSVVPPRDDMVSTYHTLAGAWIAGGAFATAKTAEWAEKTPISSKPALYLGTVAVAAMPTLVASVLWRQGWRSVGE